MEELAIKRVQELYHARAVSVIAGIEPVNIKQLRLAEISKQQKQSLNLFK